MLMETPGVERPLEKVRPLADARSIDFLVTHLCQCPQGTTYMTIKTIARTENVADAEDHVAGSFGSKSGFVAGGNLILTNPFNRPTCTSAVVGEEVDRHVIGAQYHTGRWHGSTPL